MRKSIIKSKYALDSFVVLRSLVTTRSRKGFGSFHSEDVEVLIRQSAEQYVCPEVYDEILHASAMDRNSTKENFRFGDAAKSGMFALDKQWTFINHGAFGATLQPLLRESSEWRNKCESQPLRFYDRQLLPMVAHSVRETAKFLGCPPDELIPLQNVTSGLNSVINSTPLKKGDEVVCLSLTYGSTKKILKAACERTGATLIIVEVSLPVTSPHDVISRLQSVLGGATKLVVLDQVTSNTAMVLPIADLSLISREVGATVVIDAAHALFSQDCSMYTANQRVHSTRLLSLLSLKGDNNSQTQSGSSQDSSTSKMVSIADIADVWITNAHKWMCSPKGCAFMWVSPSMSQTLQPSIISHGYIPQEKSPVTDDDEQCIVRGRLLSGFSWDGCRDYSALLTMPSAIYIWQSLADDLASRHSTTGGSGGNAGGSNCNPNSSHTASSSSSSSSSSSGLTSGDLSIFRDYNRALLRDASLLLTEQWGVREEDYAAPKDMRSFSSMALIPLPHSLRGIRTNQGATDKEAFGLQELLHFDHSVEVPVKCLEGKLYVRISSHVYNTPEDYQKLAYVIKSLM